MATGCHGDGRHGRQGPPRRHRRLCQRGDRVRALGGVDLARRGHGRGERDRARDRARPRLPAALRDRVWGPPRVRVRSGGRCCPRGHRRGRRDLRGRLRRRCPNVASAQRSATPAVGGRGGAGAVVVPSARAASTSARRGADGVRLRGRVAAGVRPRRERTGGLAATTPGRRELRARLRLPRLAMGGGAADLRRGHRARSSCRRRRRRRPGLEACQGRGGLGAVAPPPRALVSPHGAQGVSPSWRVAARRRHPWHCRGALHATVGDAAGEPARTDDTCDGAAAAVAGSCGRNQRGRRLPHLCPQRRHVGLPLARDWRR